MRNWNKLSKRELLQFDMDVWGIFITNSKLDENLKSFLVNFEMNLRQYFYESSNPLRIKLLDPKINEQIQLDKQRGKLSPPIKKLSKKLKEYIKISSEKKRMISSTQKAQKILPQNYPSNNKSKDITLKLIGKMDKRRYNF